MKRSLRSVDQRGQMNTLLLPLVAAGGLLLVAIIFGAWAFSSREDYRTNVDQKIAVAVKSAKQEESALKDKEHAEADKSPLRTYKGPEQYGSVQIAYPKTWSGYVSDSGDDAYPINGYFQPGVVPDTGNKADAFALRVQVLNQSYAKVITGFQSNIAANKIDASAFAFPKVPNVVGLKLQGQVSSNRDLSATMVVVPLRDKTLEVWTESPQYLPDFTTYILPNVTFSP